MPRIVSGLLFALLLTSGCAEQTTTPQPGAPPVPVMAVEPPYTAGTTNSLSWTTSGSSGEIDYRLQVASDPDFLNLISDLAELTTTSHTVTDLPDGQLLYYRVQAHAGKVTASEWSEMTSSTQDASPPTSSLSVLEENQTSLRVRLSAETTDEISGVLEVELWVSFDSGEYELFGLLEDGETTYIADAGGSYEFTTVARDISGNTEALGDAPIRTTDVPNPIIIIDQLGGEWDITNAVHAYNMWPIEWAQGIGPDVISPIVDPDHISRGEPGYPDDDEIFVVLVMNDGNESLAMPLNPMYSHEVLDDEFAGEPIAMTY
jgi:hypothetical protein